jgi:hypothetical protein
MNKGRVGEERGGKEMDRCPLIYAMYYNCQHEPVHIFVPGNKV